jgi:hypothetical protein
MSKECPNCATDVDAKATVCPICRYEFPSRPVLPWKPVTVLVLIVVLVPLGIRLFRLLVR